MESIEFCEYKDCYFCLGEGTVIKKAQWDSIEVRGEFLDLYKTNYVCETCGNVVWRCLSEYKNLIVAYRMYRKKHKMLTPEMVIAFRKKIGLSEMDD